MTVAATSAVANPATASTSSAAAPASATHSLSYNDFLTLLMAEM